MGAAKLVGSVLLLALSSMLLGCASVSGPEWLPGTLSDEKPYLQQLDRQKAPGATDSPDIEQDVKVQQSNSLGLLHMPALENDLNQKLIGIKQAIGFEQLPGRVYILASPSMNAITSAQGNIYIPIGMVPDIQSSDEMVALLAHEISHTLLNHTGSDTLFDLQRKATQAWTLANKLGIDGAKRAEVNARIRNALAFSMAADQLLNPTWNRQQELAADRMAIDILVSTGSNPDAMISLLRRLDQWEKINQELRQDIKHRKSVIVDTAVAQYGDEQWKRDLLVTLTPVGLMVEDKVAEMSDTHMSSEDRIAEVRAYTRTHYRDVNRTAPDTRQWRQIAQSNAVRNQAQAVRRANRAYGALLAGSTGQANQLLRSIPTATGSGQNYYVMLNAMMAEQRRRTDQVVLNTERAELLTYPSFSLLLMRARSKARLDAKPSDAQIRELVASFDAYGTPKHHYADLISLAEGSGGVIQYELLARCHLAYFGVSAACDAEAKSKQNKTASPNLLGGLAALFK